MRNRCSCRGSGIGSGTEIPSDGTHECTEYRGLLRIEVYEPVTEQLTSGRAISDLVAVLRNEMSAGRRAFAG